jgi:two-component system, chemotaxis family, sensor kinase CheA
MDDLLREFVTETNESLDVVDVELVRFEQEPNNAEILGNVFRLVHTIKGTCGFLALPRLEALAHAAEALMGKFRDGVPATSEAVTVILASIDRIKSILEGIERDQREPEGSDADLIGRLEQLCEQAGPSPKFDPDGEVPTAPELLVSEETYERSEATAPQAAAAKDGRPRTKTKTAKAAVSRSASPSRRSSN